MQAEAPQQLWFDVERPIQPRPPRDRTVLRRIARVDSALPSPQMELHIAIAPAAPATTVQAIEVRTPAESAAPPPLRENPVRVAPPREARPCFVAWLREQGKRGGAIGELAKAARNDPRFPRAGSADEVRSRFNSAGADGDAFAALDDAERAYDRAA